MGKHRIVDKPATTESKPPKRVLSVMKTAGGVIAAKTEIQPAAGVHSKERDDASTNLANCQMA